MGEGEREREGGREREREREITHSVHGTKILLKLHNIVKIPTQGRVLKYL